MKPRIAQIAGNCLLIVGMLLGLYGGLYFYLVELGPIMGTGLGGLSETIPNAPDDDENFIHQRWVPCYKMGGDFASTVFSPIQQFEEWSRPSKWRYKIDLQEAFRKIGRQKRDSSQSFTPTDTDQEGDDHESRYVVFR